MPVTRTALRASTGEHSNGASASVTSAELPLAKTREVRQAAMGSPYASPQSAKTKTVPACSTASSQLGRGQFGTLISNGLPSGVRAKFSRHESMPLLSQPIDDVSEPSDAESASPIAARTRTATKHASTTLSTSTTSSTHQRRTGAGVKRSASDSNNQGTSSSAGPRRTNDSPSAHDNDGDDGEDPRRNRRRSSRLGGCSSQPEARHDRDDSNKENIAPFNPHQNTGNVEVVIELGPRARTMARRSVSSPIINFSSESLAQSSNSPNPRRSARRSLNRTESQASGRRSMQPSLSSMGPSTPNRRARGGPLSPTVNEATLPASPFARLNIGTGGPSALSMIPSFSTNTSLADDAESSYLSSQGSGSVAPSIFDSTSQFADEDFDMMDDLSLIPGQGGHGHHASVPPLGFLGGAGARRGRGNTADGSQDSSVYSRASSLLSDPVEESTKEAHLEPMDSSTPMATELEPAPDSEDSEMQEAAAAAAAAATATAESDDESVVEEAALPKETAGQAPKGRRYPNVYAHARALLRHGSTETTQAGDGSKGGGDEVEIVGREAESVAIKTFLSARLGKSAAGCLLAAEKLPSSIEVGTSVPSLYICGQPGTGKTALVRSIISELLGQQQQPTTRKLRTSTGTRVAFVNCMSITAPRLIFGQILMQLGTEWRPESDPLNTRAERALEDTISKMDYDVLIVLDEIDHLLENGNHQSILQRLFCIGNSRAAQSNKSAKCALIGIANSLDLTEHFMPLLVSTGMAPTVLHMRPFSAEDIVNVVRSRLAGLHARYDDDGDSASPPAPNVIAADAIFAKPALALASKKMAAATGDLRKALDICRSAVELVESEQRQRMVDVMTTDQTANEVVASELLAPLTPETAPRVSMAHILSVFNAVLGSAQVGRVRALGMQAKFFLLALLVAQRRWAEGLQVLGCDVDDKVVRAVGGSGGGGGSASKAAAAGRGRGVRFSEVEMTYAKMLKNDGSPFPVLERSELLQVIEGLEVAGIVSLANESGSGASSNSSCSSSAGSGHAASGKRGGGKKIQPATNRTINLLISQDDVRHGITSLATGGGAANTVVAEAISRMWAREETRIERSRGWEVAAAQSEAVRRDELGGGRGFQPIGL